ncbi:dTDP-4-amino-4,6-dideoxyglucose formyltransferase [Helicobacter sp. 10-6591]|uniref:dTDP-4-amino-4,6-dideoxyglucose formyltransferase n=1 Tax=Helicobacter sp. 10-6591 TaxID=2004998 RepID=UPI000DCB0EC0|nr:dTDP-4-amino-4,6-dideoxyglucose formyltransferase [Helicobacter sp. 10-6591]RAX51942.1 hypothetical protein CCY97_07930 [Helicobacter sp. 10-6591]
MNQKVFVYCDNLRVFDAVLDIFKQTDIDISYFCAPKFSYLFSTYPFVTPLDIKENIEILCRYDLGFSLHSTQIFPSKLIDSVKCINLHPGYNPYNKGIFPHVFSLLNNLPAGVTLHMMSNEIDNGDIIDQVEIPIYTDDTSKTLYERILKTEIELFSKNLNMILKNSYNTTKTTIRGNYNSKSDYKKICHIDLDEILSMRDAINRFRALTHPPHKNAYFLDSNGEKIYIEITLTKD